jgi:hypothetical protein
MLIITAALRREGGKSPIRPPSVLQHIATDKIQPQPLVFILAAWSEWRSNKAASSGTEWALTVDSRVTLGEASK